MKKISFDELDKKIDKLSVHKKDWFLHTTSDYKTPNIGDLIVKKSNIVEKKGQKRYICSMDTIRKIRNLLHNDAYKGREIDEDEYLEISDFVLGENVPEEEKIALSKYFNEDIKHYLFGRFYENLKKNDKYFQLEEVLLTDDNGNPLKPLFYNPKINGVPFKSANNQKIDIDAYKLFEKINNPEFKFQNREELVVIKYFLDSNEYFDKPWCLDSVKDKKEKINNSEFVKKEIESVLNGIDNQRIDIFKNLESVEHSTNINEKLKEQLLKDMPQDFSQMEKSMYLYIKLCQVLSYDGDFVLTNDPKEHSKVSNIQTYDGTNNKVVCYEFSYIYADLLKSIGVEHIRENNADGEKFRNVHTYIDFLVDDMPIKADSTTTSDKGDLLNAKIYYKLNGFRCYLYDENKQREFKETLDKVYSYIHEKDNQLDMLPKDEKVENLDVVEKVKLFNKCIKESGFRDYDLVSYANKLRLEMFTNDELDKNMKLITDENLNCIVGFNCGDFSYTPDMTAKYIIDSKTGDILIEENEKINEHEEKAKRLDESVLEKKKLDEEIEKLQKAKSMENGEK